MKEKLCSVSIFGIVGLLGASSSVLAGTFETLKADERSQLMAGKQVLHESKDPIIPKAPWPKFEAFQVIQASPEEAAAVFWDTANHKNFIPNLKKSDTVSTGKSTVDVHYSMELPMKLGTESYTVHDTLRAEQGAYEVSWEGVPNSSFSYSVGRARFEPVGDVTLLIYTSSINSIRWGSSLPWVVSGVRTQLLETVDSLVNRIEGEKAGNSDLLQQEIGTLRAALAN